MEILAEIHHFLPILQMEERHFRTLLSLMRKKRFRDGKDDTSRIHPSSSHSKHHLSHPAFPSFQLFVSLHLCIIFPQCNLFRSPDHLSKTVLPSSSSLVLFRPEDQFYSTREITPTLPFSYFPSSLFIILPQTSHFFFIVSLLPVRPSLAIHCFSISWITFVAPIHSLFPPITQTRWDSIIATTRELLCFSCSIPQTNHSLL